MVTLFTVNTIFIGAIITWIVTTHYSHKAAKELKAETVELKELNTLMLRALERAGLAKFDRDKNGNIKDMRIHLFSGIEDDET